MKVWVLWDDPQFKWADPAEDFLWDQAYRIVQDVMGALGDWWTPRKKKQIEQEIPKRLAEKFFDVVIDVNGLKHTFKGEKPQKPKITIDHIQKTFREFEYDKKVSVKAEITKK